MGWDSPLAQAELLADWPEIVGDETAAHAAPIGIEDGVLTVRCDSTAWATQLRRMSADDHDEDRARIPRGRHRVGALPGTGRPLLETRPQSNPRAWSARYLRLTRQIRSSAPRKGSTGPISPGFEAPLCGRITGSGEARSAAGFRPGRSPPLHDIPLLFRGLRSVVRRRRHPGSRRPRGGPQAPRHVHRLDRPARPAPPGLRDRRQLRRRGPRRLLRPHRGDDPRRRRRALRRQRSRHPGRHAPGREEVDRRGRADDPARRRQVRRRRVRGLGRSARRRQLGRQRALAASSRSRCAGRATSTRRATTTVCPTPRSRRARRPTRPARRSPSGRTPRSSRPSSSTTRPCARASSRWRSSTRACASRSTDERPEEEDARPSSAATSSSTSAASSTTSST